MQKANRFLGGVLLISGTAIGAGMLAMPVTTAFAGFYPSLLLLIFFWLFMTCTALLYLEVNLAMPGESNLITMAGKTLGTLGKGISWTVYLLLLYSLTAAYISGSTPLFSKGIYFLFGWNMPTWFGPLPLLCVFALFIYLGTRSVDYINRILMLGLALAYILLVIFLPSEIDNELLQHADFSAVLLGIPVVITSFGFHIIIPSLTTYMKHDRKLLTWTIILGSLIPFLVYVLWEWLLLGVVPLSGEYGLIKAWENGNSATQSLEHILKTRWIATGATLFAFFAILTSFLGVSLSLSDFLADGFKIKRTNGGRVLACLLTFIPPLGFVSLYPHGFILALQYAGIFVAILLGFLPACMAWKLPKPSFYASLKGKILLLSIMLISIAVIAIDILEQKGVLKMIVANYLDK